MLSEMEHTAQNEDMSWESLPITIEAHIRSIRREEVWSAQLEGFGLLWKQLIRLPNLELHFYNPKYITRRN